MTLTITFFLLSLDLMQMTATLHGAVSEWPCIL